MERYDERHNVQARATLEPGTADYDDFYRAHPDWKAKDDAIRALPGLGNVGSKLDRPFLGALHEFVARLGMEDRVDGPVAPEKADLSPERATQKVKGYATYLGADLVRVGPLDPLYVYSNVGKTWHDPARSYGRLIELPHANAISLAVGISPRLLQTGPVLSEVVEIMRVYVRAATIAVTLAEYIRARIPGCLLWR